MAFFLFKEGESLEDLLENIGLRVDKRNLLYFKDEYVGQIFPDQKNFYIANYQRRFVDVIKLKGYTTKLL